MTDRRRGSSFVFVIVLVMLISILSAGLYYMTAFNLRATEQNYQEQQSLYLAKSVHRSVCQVVESGRLALLDDVLSDVVLSAGEDAEQEYAVSTGITEITLSSGADVQVKIDVMVVVEPDRGVLATIDTLVIYADATEYRFSALLSPIDFDLGDYEQEDETGDDIGDGAGDMDEIPVSNDIQAWNRVPEQDENLVAEEPGAEPPVAEHVKWKVIRHYEPDGEESGL